MEDKLKSRKQLVVIGGGAAGFFCAVNAAMMNPDLEVTLIEKTSKLLSKVRISGGGRCNVTHACFDIGEMSRNYPRGEHFVKKSFHQFFTTDTIEWFGERGVKLKTEKDGRMFPVTDSSQTIIDCLLKEAGKHNVRILMNTEVKAVRISKGKFDLEFPDSRLLRQGYGGQGILTPDYLCIACGGYPKMSMFGWLSDLGHTIDEPVPSLFTFNMPGNPITKLMGISIDEARIRIAGTKLEELGPLLITHWGMSGPAILKLSAWGARELKSLNYEFKITVNWVPTWKEQDIREKFSEQRLSFVSQKIANRNPFGLPARLWEFFVDQSGIKPETRWADLPSKEQNKLLKNLTGFEADVRGKTSFKEEFVTAGGIKLNEVDANTMMSKKIPNLFFTGEVLDVDGITGGFNFQHAWTSGYVAANCIAHIPV